MHTFKVGDKVRAIPGTRNPDGTDFFSDGKIEDVMPHAIIVQWESTRQYTRHTHNQLKKVNAMTDRKNHLHELDKQRTTAQEFEKYYKELRETIEAEIVTVTNQREIIIGQLWKYACTREYYIVTMSSELSLELTNVHAGGVLKIPTSSIQEHFNYIGMACNHVKVTE